MRVNTSAGQVAAKNSARAKAFKTYLRPAVVRAQKRIQFTAVGLSQGTIPQSVLSKRPPGLNNPYGIGPVNRYGARGPQPYGSAPVINKQSGEFVSRWKTFGTYSATEVVVVLQNNTPYASALEYGTELMRRRDIIGQIHKIEDSRFTADILAAFRRAYGVP